MSFINGMMDLFAAIFMQKEDGTKLKKTNNLSTGSKNRY
jgi:hypothetical protein